VVDTLRDGVSGAGDCDCALCGVGQHVGRHLNGGAGHLADLLDLGAALADEGTALRRGHDEAQRDGRPRHATAGTATASLHLVELKRNDQHNQIHVPPAVNAK